MSKTEFSDRHNMFQTFCRPGLTELLTSVGLDKIYKRGEGDYLYYDNEQGQEIQVLDFLGGYGANLFGHNHPRLNRTAQEMFQQNIPFNCQGSIRGGAGRTAAKLSEILEESCGKRFVTTFTNSGTEAVEAALKHAELQRFNKVATLKEQIKKEIIHFKKLFKQQQVAVDPRSFERASLEMCGPENKNINEVIAALLSHNQKVFSERPLFLCLKNSFHGKTTGSLQLTHKLEYREPFARLGPRTHFVDPLEPESLQQAAELAHCHYYRLTLQDGGIATIIKVPLSSISAFFIEPLQGEGGIQELSAEFLKNCRSMATKNNFSLVFDEIQCGMGRTGTFLYSEQLNVTADYYLLSKSLGGGLSKIAALLIDEEQYDPEFGVLHSSTFTEDDFSAAIAHEALLMLQDEELGIYEKCQRQGQFLKAGLGELKSKYPSVVKDIRGKGLMLGIQFAAQGQGASNVIYALSNQNLLGFVIAGYLLNEHNIRIAPTLSSNHTIRLEPSAFISEADCRVLFKALDRLCSIIEKQDAYLFLKYIVGAASPEESAHVIDYRPAVSLLSESKHTQHVAFMGHFIKGEDVADFDPSCALFTKKQRETLIKKTYKLLKPQQYAEVTIESLGGAQTCFHFIGIFADSKIISEKLVQRDIASIHDKIEQAVDLAVSLGASIVGFGGYCSIVTRNCRSIITDEIALTSGNSLTVGMGVTAIFQAAKELSIDLQSSCFAAVGANGNIASVYCHMMAEKVPQLIFIGRAGREEQLKSVACEIYCSIFKDILEKYNGASQHSHGKNSADFEMWATDLAGVARAIFPTRALHFLLENYRNIPSFGQWLYEKIEEELQDKAPLRIATDMSALKDANLILGSSNQPVPIIFPKHLGQGPIAICDIAVPLDTHPDVMKSRPDVMHFQGGVVQLPLTPHFKLPGMPLEKGSSFACMAETMLLGLAGINQNYSIGSINKVQVKNILEIAKMHGFSLARLKKENSY